MISVIHPPSNSILLCDVSLVCFWGVVVLGHEGTSDMADSSVSFYVLGLRLYFAVSVESSEVLLRKEESGRGTVPLRNNQELYRPLCHC